jgi:hypothetical protein
MLPDGTVARKDAHTPASYGTVSCNSGCDLRRWSALRWAYRVAESFHMGSISRGWGTEDTVVAAHPARDKTSGKYVFRSHRAGDTGWGT